MKKILIFYGSYGGGHLAAAKSIAGFLNDNYKGDVEVKLVDCIEYINKYINKVSTEAYKELAKAAPWAWKHVYKNSQNGALSYISNTTNRLMSHKLNLLLQEFQPDLIISTHPFSTQMCAILKKRNKINCKLATILTDYHIHAQWLVLYKYCDYFFVSNDQMKHEMIQEGVNEKRIYVTGIPVSERFSENFDSLAIHKEFGLDPNKYTVLFFAGGEFGLGRNTTFMVLKALIRMFKQLQVVAISGKNKKMNQKFHQLVETTQSQDRVKILEFTNKVPELMSISIGVITKPGGLTVTESLVSNLPICIINPIPGQEEENANFLVDNNVAIWIRKGDGIARTLKNISRDPDKYMQMKENTKKLAKPDATGSICNILMNDFDDIKKLSNKVIVTGLIKHNNKYLFVKRNRKEPIYPDCYELIGGVLEKDEELLDALHRHAMQDVQISIKNVKSVGFNNDIITYKSRLNQLILLRYTAETTSFKTIPSNSILEVAWLTKEDIQKSKFSKPTTLFLKEQNLL